MYYDPYEMLDGYDEEALYVQGPPPMRGGPEGMGGFRRDVHLIDEVSEAIIREVHAYNYYERLARLAANMQQRQVILGIQRDEARHYQWFTMILRMLGGQQPRIPPGPLPRTFREGVRDAIRDELDAVSFYRDIANSATARPIQMRFMHASNDERRHAALLQNMLRGM